MKNKIYLPHPFVQLAYRLKDQFWTAHYFGMDLEEGKILIFRTWVGWFRWSLHHWFSFKNSGWRAYFYAPRPDRTVVANYSEDNDDLIFVWLSRTKNQKLSALDKTFRSTQIEQITAYIELLLEAK